MADSIKIQPPTEATSQTLMLIDIVKTLARLEAAIGSSDALGTKEKHAASDTSVPAIQSMMLEHFAGH